MDTLLLTSDEKDLSAAADIIRRGGLVAFPTETVYGLGANALNDDAARKIYEAKGRPSDNPLIVHLPDVSRVEEYAYPDRMFYKLSERFMPGPLTVIVEKKPCIPDTVTGGLDSVGIRIPSDKIANAFLRACDVPIAAPSANLSGKPSPTNVQHVIDDMSGRIDAIIKSDNCDVGVESTIVSLVSGVPMLLRPGKITLEELREVLPSITVSEAVTSNYVGKAMAPGMRYKHYAPRANLYILDGTYEEVLDFLKDKDGCAKLCFSEDSEILKMPNSMVWASEFDSLQQAKELFGCLRKFDSMKEIDTVYARMPSSDGVGLAVFNRLLRASGFKIIKF